VRRETWKRKKAIQTPPSRTIPQSRKPILDEWFATIKSSPAAPRFFLWLFSWQTLRNDPCGPGPVPWGRCWSAVQCVLQTCCNWYSFVRSAGITSRTGTISPANYQRCHSPGQAVFCGAVVSDKATWLGASQRLPSVRPSSSMPNRLFGQWQNRSRATNIALHVKHVYA
jgi:hypothetical protein